VTAFLGSAPATPRPTAWYASAPISTTVTDAPGWWATREESPLAFVDGFENTLLAMVLLDLHEEGAKDTWRSTT
jgi:hypothetical protein